MGALVLEMTILVVLRVGSVTRIQSYSRRRHCGRVWRKNDSLIGVIIFLDRARRIETAKSAAKLGAFGAL